MLLFIKMGKISEVNRVRIKLMWSRMASRRLAGVFTYGNR